MFASPGYHRAYLLIRSDILNWHVNQQLSEDLDPVEALTAIRSKDIRFSTERESAIALLDTWRRKNEIHNLSQLYQLPCRLDRPDSLEEVIDLLHFKRILQFFLVDFALNAPKPPMLPITQWKDQFLPLALSSLERQRILRALCRLQTLKNIFGDPVHCSGYPFCGSCKYKNHWRNRETTEQIQFSTDPYNDEDDQYAFRLFYGTMPPWEYEEMGSVFGYFKAKIDLVGKDIAHDLRKFSKRTACDFFQDIIPAEERPPPGSTIASDINLILFPDKDAGGLAGLGPEFLYRLFHMDRLAQRNTVCRNTRDNWYGPFIGSKISLSWELRFPLIEPADRHERPGFETRWSSLSSIEQPTIEWKRTWLLPHEEETGLEYAIDIDERDETDWHWCYALWDEERLEEWKSHPCGEKGLPSSHTFIMSETENILIAPSGQ